MRSWQEAGRFDWTDHPLADTILVAAHAWRGDPDLLDCPSRQGVRVRRITILVITIPLLTFMSCGGSTTTGGGGAPIDNPPVAPAALQKVYTEHLGSLIGTVQYSSESVGLIGTDLGSSFERDGKLVFLFGDGWTTNPAYWDGDPAAWVDPAANPLVTGEVPELHWFLESTGQFLPLRVPGVDMGPFNVPLEGVPVGSDTYLFVATGLLINAPQLVLARADGLAFDALSVESKTPAGKFLNVSVVEDGGFLWIFGSGTYRQSAVYLARVEPSRISDRNAWSYFRGYEQGAPVFGLSESSATPVVSAACVGELSVRRHEGLGYLMSYNCDNPRGIHLRFAEQPAGPWSAPIVIFQPGADHGYGFFMHQKESEVNYDDGLSGPGRTDEWGGEYGPYMIPQWTTSDTPGVFSIVYTLSSWNPYKAHLMRSIVAKPGVAASLPPERGTNLPPATLVNGDFAAGDLSGWQTSGDAFAVIPGTGGQWWLTTNVPLEGGTAVQGEAWQDFSIDAKTHELRFTVSGGDAASVKLQLLRGGVVIDNVRASWGRRSDTTETPVHWLLDDLHGETVRLLIEDHSADDWGYVTTTGFTFVQDP